MVWIAIVFSIILLGALELFLAGRKSRWTGLVLPVLLLFLLVPMTISTASVYFPIPIMNYSYGDETLDNVKIYYGVIYDKEGKVAAFSDLKVKDKETGEVTWCPMEFDEQGKLIGGEEAMKYKENVERIAGDVAETKGQKSRSPAQMRWLYVRHNNGGYRDAAVIMALSYLAEILYFCIYGTARKRIRKRERLRQDEKRRMLQAL